MTRSNFKQMKIPIIVIVASFSGAAGRQNTFSAVLPVGENKANRVLGYSYEKYITTYFYLTNLQGDVIGLVTDEGVGAYYKYDAWGD